jgi:hypothetical protein
MVPDTRYLFQSAEEARRLESVRRILPDAPAAPRSNSPCRTPYYFVGKTNGRMFGPAGSHPLKKIGRDGAEKPKKSAEPAARFSDLGVRHLN